VSRPRRQLPQQPGQVLARHPHRPHPRRVLRHLAESGVDGTFLKIEKSFYPEGTWDSEPLAVSLVVKSDDS